MGQLLTTASTLTCPHGGMVVAVPSQARWSAAGAPVVLASDTFMVAACPFLPGAPHPCVLVTWIVPSAESRAGGSPTLTTDSVGLCQAADGAVQGPVLIVAAQPRVSGR